MEEQHGLMNHAARRAANGRLRGEELAELRENLEREVEHNRQRTQLQLERTRVRRAGKRRQQRLARGAERVSAKLQFNHRNNPGIVARKTALKKAKSIR